MQKTANKQFWADYVPIADRKLEYYWTSGATVTLNDDTGKFRLNYYTSSGGTTATSSHSGGAKNGGTAGGAFGNWVNAAVSKAKSFIRQINSRRKRWKKRSLFQLKRNF